MWLINRLKPDFKTIADFRKNNKLAFVATCCAFVRFCRMGDLIAGDLVAIDGSKFQAVASSRRHMNLKQLKRQEEKLDKRIAQYLADLDEAEKRLRWERWLIAARSKQHWRSLKFGSRTIRATKC